MNENPEIDPDIEARARECLRRYLAGDLDPSQLIFGRPRKGHAKVADKIRELFGDVVSVTFVASTTNALGITKYRFNVAFHDAQLEYHYGLKPDGTMNQFSIKALPGQDTWLRQLFEPFFK